MSASPPPKYVVVERDLGRGVKFYVYAEPVDFARHPSGGPYASEADAEAEIERRYKEMSDLYDAVERQAREGGYTVTWGPR